MLQLLIVEDEQMTRIGLETVVDWASLSIGICGLAANGEEALELIQTKAPDILLTDIRMPLMDGLRLMEEVRRRGLDIPCVLMSGYNDFDYAQRAIRLGVMDYLIKPCSPASIMETFREVAKRINEKRRLIRSLDGLKHRLDRSLPIAKSQLLQKWLRSPRQATENRRQDMEELRMAISDRQVIVLVFHPDRKPVEELNYKTADLELLRFAAGNIVKETLEAVLLAPVETVAEQTDIVAVANGQEPDFARKFEQGWPRLRQNLLNYLKITVSVGISRSKPSIDRLDEAYAEARAALDLRFYQGPGAVYRYEEGMAAAAQDQAANETLLIAREQTILDHLRAGLYAEALTETERWLSDIQATPARSWDAIQLHAQSLVARLAQLLQEPPAAAAPGDGGAVVGSDGGAWLAAKTGAIGAAESVDELSGLVLRTLREVVESVNPNKTPRRKIQQAIDYIAGHLESSDMSLAGVAQELFVSSTYLSTLFKQELGVNFLDYVHQCRIEKAKAMLQAGDAKIQTIAKQLGYFDEAHFTKTFKKWAGVTPSRYRKEIQGGL